MALDEFQTPTGITPLCDENVGRDCGRPSRFQTPTGITPLCDNPATAIPTAVHTAVSNPYGDYTSLRLTFEMADDPVLDQFQTPTGITPLCDLKPMSTCRIHTAVSNPYGDYTSLRPTTYQPQLPSYFIPFKQNRGLIRRFTACLFTL